ncbi:hypothetical protein [uncultured Cohaesibacter sp.]|uniref:hypothetical protein n=1 Tax=uncultured Cohaesibacter sp. TaxID=1002546 RepID=UPI0029C86F26|nr:hypothetical protein [uncultured Cohaesibacter sp.]
MQHQTPEEQGSAQRWIFFILIAGLIAITFLYVLSRVFEYSGPSLINSPYSFETSPRQITIGERRLSVPENVIRSADQRAANTLKQLDLVFLWPTLEGFSREKQVAFSDATEASSLLFVSLSQPKELLQSSERLFSVYSQFFTGTPIKGPATLIGFEMDKASGFGGETIYFKPEATEPFVARCIASNDKEPAFCMREIALGGSLQVSYRFRPHLLNYWKSLDAALLERLNRFLLP